MANPEHLAILEQSVEAWNQWRRENPDVIHPDLLRAHLLRADLRGADLSGAGLFDANLRRADLRGADLSGADLSGANLLRADLRGASLTKADLTKADLSGANLTKADLSGANLLRADLHGADLTKANLTKANLTGAGLFDANLTSATLTKANLTGADLFDANLTSATLTKANLIDANLAEATLVRTNLTGATLTNARIYGISAWDVKKEGLTQENLIITPHGEPEVMVDDFEVAQFVYMLLEHEKLGQVLNTIMERGVLLLGPFKDGGIERLRAIATRLRDMKYLPIIFEFDRPPGRTYTETIKTLVGLSRFVIVDLSGPSVPAELEATVPHFKLPFVPILEKGRHPYSMFVDLLENEWVLKPIVEFTSEKELLDDLPTKVIEPAEKRVEERQHMLDELFGSAGTVGPEGKEPNSEAPESDSDGGETPPDP